jgi:hypothetical protein
VVRVDCEGVEDLRVVLLDSVLALAHEADQFVLDDLQPLL